MTVSTTLAEQRAAHAMNNDSQLRARCPDCDHRWTVAYLPMDMGRVGELGKVARCPFGCTGKALLA